MFTPIIVRALLWHLQLYSWRSLITKQTPPSWASPLPRFCAFPFLQQACTRNWVTKYLITQVKTYPMHAMSVLNNSLSFISTPHSERSIIHFQKIPMFLRRYIWFIGEKEFLTYLKMLEYSVFLFCCICFAAKCKSVLTRLQRYGVGIFSWRKQQSCKVKSRSTMTGMELRMSFVTPRSYILRFFWLRVAL